MKRLVVQLDYEINNIYNLRIFNVKITYSAYSLLRYLVVVYKRTKNYSRKPKFYGVINDQFRFFFMVSQAKITQAMM